MAGSFKFAVLRLAPKDVRREVLNVGIIVFGGPRAEFHFSRGLDKVKSISRAIQVAEIIEITNNMANVYSSFMAEDNDADTAFSLISDFGPLSLDCKGVFSAATNHVYYHRINSILKTFIDPEPAIRRNKEKRSKILTDIKQVFRNERVLAKKNEDLSSHRIVSSVEIEEGLTADLVLKNGSLHVTETVDASSEDISLRKVIADLGVSSLVLERAKMSYLNAIVKANLVYGASASIERSMKPALDAAEHFGAQLINWSSKDDRDQYLKGLISLAVPYEDKQKQSGQKAVVGGRLNFH